MEKQLKMMRKIRGVFLIVLIAALIVFLIVATWAMERRNKAVAAGWGDNSGGRPSYTVDQINEGVLNDKIVFNSISDSVMGNEKNFVGARVDTGINAGEDNVWNANEITVEDNQIYIIRAYVHNNSPLGYDGLAENVRIAFNIPTSSSTSIPVHGYIYCDNASPSEYWDGVLLQSDKPFHLEYIYGSALIENRGYASKENGGAKPLSDEIVTKAASNHGVNIGYAEENDGLIPGGYAYDCYVTIRVKVVFDTEYRVEQRVRLAGTSEWQNHVDDVKVGDILEFRIQYKNISEDSIQENVMIKDILPDNLRYLSGTTTLINSNSTWTDYGRDSLFTTGVNIGHYAAGANALIDFTAEVVDNSLQDGSNTLVNWSQCGVGQKTIQDYASVTVYKGND